MTVSELKFKLLKIVEEYDQLSSGETVKKYGLKAGDALTTRVLQAINDENTTLMEFLDKCIDIFSYEEIEGEVEFKDEIDLCLPDRLVLLSSGRA